MDFFCNAFRRYHQLLLCRRTIEHKYEILSRNDVHWICLLISTVSEISKKIVRSHPWLREQCKLLQVLANFSLYLKHKILDKLVHSFSIFVFELHQIPVTSPLIQTQSLEASVCQRGTERLLILHLSQCFLIIQIDSVTCMRCCVERRCEDAVTGSFRVVVQCVFLFPIRALAGRKRVSLVDLDIMNSPGVCIVLPHDVHSDTITK